MTEYKNIIIVETNEAGQPTNLRRLDDGDTISNERLNTDVRTAASGFSDLSSTVDSLEVSTGGVSSLVDNVSSVVDSLEVSTGGLSSLVDGVSSVVTDLETSTRNMSGLVDGVSSVVDSLELSTKNLSSILDGSTNFPNTDLETSTRNMSSLVDGISSIVDSLELSTKNLSSILDGSTNFPSTDLETSTRNMSGLVDGVSSIVDSLELSTKNLSSIVDSGIGSSVASAIAVGNGSAVIVSGADTPGTSIDAPANNMALVIDTADRRVKFKKIRGGTGGMIEAGSIEAQDLGEDSVGTTQLAAGAAVSNVNASPANSINYNSLPLVNANSFIGNSHPTNGATMGQITNTTARNMLGLSAGTVAPPSPSEGDLWYNTTDDELYTYDSGRGHWLGCPYYISMGKANAATGAGVGHFLYVGHQGTAATTQEKGWLVPHDMVITGWRGHSSTTFDGWNVRIDKNSGGTNTTGIVQTGALGSVDTFSDFTLDVDVAAGDILGVAIVLGSVTIDASTVIIKIQRKGA